MVDKKSEKELELEASTAESEDSNLPKSNKKLLILAGAVMLLIGAAISVWFFILAPSDELESVEIVAEEEVPRAEYLVLEPPFIVNYSDQGRQRFLQTDIAIMTRDPAIIPLLHEHAPMVRHNLSAVLAAQTLEMLRSREGIEKLRREVTEELQKILLAETEVETGIEEVLFTSFVLQ